MQWAIAGPVISQLLNHDEEEDDDEKYHGGSPYYERVSQNDCHALKQAFEAHGNPFDETEAGLIHFTSKRLMSNEEEQSVKENFKIGQEQYKSFDQSRTSIRYNIKEQVTNFSSKEQYSCLEQKARSITSQGAHQFISRPIYCM